MELIIKENKNEIGIEIAKIIINEVRLNPRCVLGLATGSSPLPIYENLIKFSKEENIDFSEVTTFNLDEYLGINKEDKNSYRYFMYENLFKYLNIKKENINFPSEENYLIYDDLILSKGGIDIQLLGIGANGHIAFNEPYTNKDSKTHIVNLTKKTIEDNSRFFDSIDLVPKKAITMGLNTISKSKKVILIATGKNKSEAIKKVLEEKYIESIPASLLNEIDNSFIYLDKECYDNIK